MKSLKKVLPALLLITGAVACNSDPAPDLSGAGAQPESLDGMDTRELIKAKYDRLSLDCNMEFMDGTVGDDSPEKTGKGEAHWDLLKDFDEQKVIEISAQSRGATGTITIKVNGIGITDGVVGGPALSDSPYILADYSYVTFGGNLGAAGNPLLGGQTFYEGIENNFLNTGRAVVNNSGAVTSFSVSCTLNSTIKAPYRHGGHHHR